MVKVLYSVVFTLLCICIQAQDFMFDVRPLQGKPVVEQVLKEAQTLKDLNPGYPDSWVSGYVSVQLKAEKGNEEIVVEGVDDRLTDDQKALLRSSEMGTNYSVRVQYMPEDNHAEGGMKEVNFSFSHVPEKTAEFIGGTEELILYLKEQAMNDIPESTQENIESVNILFTIDETGYASSIKVESSSKNYQVDQVIVKSITEMPAWIPAQNADGKPVTQTFEFVMGKDVGC